MKILAVLCQNPFTYSDGGTYAMRASLRRLEKKGDLFVTGWGFDFDQPHVGPYQSVGSLGPACNSQTRFLVSLTAGRSYSIDKYAHRTAQKIFKRIVRRGNFNVIWYEKLQAAGVAWRADLLGTKSGPVHMLRAHNVEYATFRDRFDTPAWAQRFLLLREARALKAAELNLLSKADLVLNFTREDRDQFLQELPTMAEKLLLMPAVAEDEGAYKQRNRVDGKFVSFLGDCRWRPNLLAAEWITDQLAPELLRSLPDVVIRLVGRETDAFKGRMPNVQAMGFVDHVETEYNQAVCTLAPIRHGGGVNIKVVASLAHGIPVIGTAFARRGIITAGFLQAESPAQFVAHIDQLLKDPQKAEMLGRSAQRNMEELERYFDEFWIQHLR